MSERTFRAVMASVLVGALVLAVIVAAAVYAPPAPTPSPTVSATSAAPGPTLVVVPTPTPGPAFGPSGIVSVGQVARGSTSAKTLVLQFVETTIDSIPNAPGSFRVTLADQSGDGSKVAFVGTPSVGAPGSLGATATFVGPNVLMISILASDTVNIEPITISGLGIRASSSAATGPMTAELDGFTGSLATGTAGNVLASPGSVVASQ